MSEESAPQDRGRLSANCLMQPGDIALCDDGQKGNLKKRLSYGPEGAQVDSFVALEVSPNGGTKQVRAKMTDYERRNLRIAVFHTHRNIWR